MKDEADATASGSSSEPASSSLFGSSSIAHLIDRFTKGVVGLGPSLAEAASSASVLLVLATIPTLITRSRIITNESNRKNLAGAGSSQYGDISPFITTNATTVITAHAVVGVVCCAAYFLLYDRLLCYQNNNNNNNNNNNKPINGRKQNKSKQKKNNNHNRNRIVSKIPEHIQRELYKDAKRKASVRFLSRKRPLYENIEMYHPDNVTMLCTIGSKKAKWYVRKKLAVWRDRDNDNDNDSNKEEKENEQNKIKNQNGDDASSSIRLLFTPKNSKSCKINREKKQQVTAAEAAIAIAEEGRKGGGNNARTTSDLDVDVNKEENKHDNNSSDINERMRLYNLTHKQNLCVACGVGDDTNNTDNGSSITSATSAASTATTSSNIGLVRHYVVPYAYRKRFPSKFKTHLPHDIVLLCIDCHTMMEQATKLYKTDTYEQLYRPNPDYQHTFQPMITDHYLKKLKSSARALLFHKQKLPKQRIDSYEALVRDYLSSSSKKKNVTNNKNTTGIHNDISENSATIAATDADAADTAYCATTSATNNYASSSSNNYNNISDTVLRELVETMVTEQPNPNYVPIQDLVLHHKLQTDNDIRQFVMEWRQFFVDTLQPRYLPVGWNVTSPVEIDE